MEEMTAVRLGESDSNRLSLRHVVFRPAAKFYPASRKQFDSRQNAHTNWKSDRAPEGVSRRNSAKGLIIRTEERTPIQIKLKIMPEASAVRYCGTVGKTVQRHQRE